MHPEPQYSLGSRPFEASRHPLWHVYKISLSPFAFRLTCTLAHHQRTTSITTTSARPCHQLPSKHSRRSLSVHCANIMSNEKANAYGVEVPIEANGNFDRSWRDEEWGNNRKLSVTAQIITTDEKDMTIWQVRCPARPVGRAFTDNVCRLSRPTKQRSPGHSPSQPVL